jgi:Tfp pilus tip-associated adhesin PilY1
VKFLGDSDYTDTTIHSVYGIWDYGDPVHQLGTGWSDNDDREYLGTIVRGSDPPKLSNQPDTVRLLKQEIQDFSVSVDGQDVVARVLSNHTPIWKTQEDSAGQTPDPSTSEENHAGWFFDLSPAERVISDVVLRDGRLVAIGFTPDSSRCGHGGRSFFMEANGFTGGRFDAAIFDINNDGYVGGTIGDHGDYINIGSAENPIWVPPAGILLPGNIQTPAIIGLGFGSGDGDGEGGDDNGGCREAKIFSSSSGEMPTLIEICASVGVVYWKEIR